MIEAFGEAKALLCAEHKLSVQGGMLSILHAFSSHHILIIMVFIKGTTSIGLWVWYGLMERDFISLILP